MSYMSHNTLDRRLGFRVPMEIFLNEYVQDRAHRALTVNISDTGLYVNKVLTPLQRASRVVGLEFELPGTGETIWARGEIAHDALDDYFHGQGIRFTGMAKLHARMLREYCIEKRRVQLGNLLERIRRSRLH
jgi:c-di-GMP-binding flagellar brake protein YcgR